MSGYMPIGIGFIPVIAMLTRDKEILSGRLSVTLQHCIERA